jgi:hypothetical protein
MKVEIKENKLNIDEIKSGTLVKFNEIGFTPVFYAILLKDIDGENPLLFDLENDQYYNDVDNYDIEVVNNKNIKFVIDLR